MTHAENHNSTQDASVGGMLGALVEVLRGEIRSMVRAEVRAGIAEARRDLENTGMKTKEAAAYLGMHSKTLLEHVANGRIVPDRWGSRGRSHVFNRSTLDRYRRGDAA